MKKSRIFMTLGALTLVLTGIVATKANKKAGTYSGPFYSVANSSHEVLISSGCALESNFPNFINATLTSAAGNKLTLFTKQVYGWTSSGFGNFHTLYY